MDIYQYMGKTFTCPYCGQEHAIPTKKIVTEQGALENLPDFLDSLNLRNASILLLCDDITYNVAGRRCEEVLTGDFQYETHILKPHNYRRVYAEDVYFPEIEDAAHGKDLIITIGTGSVTDMGKYVGHQLDIPVVSIPTAPSMNAYTSGVSPIISNGVKTTIPVTPAVGVLGDIDILSEAPLDLIKSGFADSLAKSFANADWRISALLTNDTYCPLPLEIATLAEKKYKDNGSLLIQRDKDAIRNLMEGLHMGGFSMVIAGKSAPASGGEHLFSHFLDMLAHRRGSEVFSYHGLQVGVGCVISAMVFERLRNLEKPVFRRIDYDRKFQELFGDERNRIAEIYSKKAPYLERLSDKWDELREIFGQVHSVEEIKNTLQSAECPVKFEQIGVEHALARRTVRSARFIRDKITILDIGDEAGILEDVVHHVT